MCVVQLLEACTQWMLSESTEEQAIQPRLVPLLHAVARAGYPVRIVSAPHPGNQVGRCYVIPGCRHARTCLGRLSFHSTTASLIDDLLCPRDPVVTENTDTFEIRPNYVRELRLDGIVPLGNLIDAVLDRGRAKVTGTMLIEEMEQPRITLKTNGALPCPADGVPVTVCVVTYKLRQIRIDVDESDTLAPLADACSDDVRIERPSETTVVLTLLARQFVDKPLLWAHRELDLDTGRLADDWRPDSKWL